MSAQHDQDTGEQSGDDQDALARGRGLVDEPPLRIAAWTQIDWAFGRIAHDLQKYLEPGIELHLFDWGTFHPPEAFSPFDLVYIPVWDHVIKFREFYPQIDPTRLCFSIHCRPELFHYNLAQARLVAYDEATIERCQIPRELLRFFRRQKLISVVSPDLYGVLHDRYGLENLRLTVIGVDLDLFSPDPTREPQSGEAITVVHTLPRRGVPPETHGYDPKRSWIAAEAERRIAEKGANVRFLFAEERLPLSRMPELYHSGDLHVCVSHAEGLPTVGLESIACGLAQLSTPVGVMPRLVRDGETGYLLRETEPRGIVDELCARILELERDRRLLREMKRGAGALRAALGWERRISAWRSFFREVARSSRQLKAGRACGSA
ncbi:MAG TPA: glycosyltransferase family 4 protein [Polyangiaceae bacterium]|jgi:glycosyltransferase involved in cell wall biosynthesis|nr:glycosyltransferase family 4 protein [Polyangiaceae bacterium]